VAHHASGKIQIVVSRYREFAAPPRLKAFVECYWALEPGDPLPAYPVLPDGCTDIVATPGEGLQIVGTMTRAQHFAVPGTGRAFGIRFRPGMASSFLRLPATESTDHSIPLSDVWGADGRRLSEQIAGAESAEECAGFLEAHLTDPAAPNRTQRICAAIVEKRGQIRVDELAFHAGLSARQLRRAFLEQTGLSPKHFCRVIRFRDSASRLAACRRGEWTQVALECGYYDQAHFINEFRELSGYSPSEFAALPR
jgi:AraC-like DNA-binding protein